MELYTHAYIVAGSSDDARNLAAALICERGGAEPCGVCAHCRKARAGIHPDIETVTTPRDKRQISIEQARALVATANIAPNEAHARVFILDPADALGVNAQDALLQLLEDPPEHVQLILRTDAPGSLIATVRSRCRVVTGSVAKTVATERVTELADAFLDAARHGAAALTRFSFELEKLDRADVAPFLDELRKRTATLARDYARGDRTVSAEFIATLRRAVGECAEYLEYNVGTPHIAAKLCAELSTD
ncbi:MAG: hypothetical protein LBN02_02915 [Oscillospiraceae bacterium]|jgi:hypothetical protein|nr:hypothetical protein [Oscillospiraceae bacterium]